MPGTPSVSEPVRPGGGVPDGIANLADAVHRAAQRDPGSPALITPGRAGATITTWAQLDAHTDAVATGLLALDLPTTAVPARVGIALPNVAEFAEALFGVLRAGLVAVPLNPGYTARELRHQLSDSGSFVIIATEPVLRAAATVRSSLPELRYAYVVDGAPVATAAPFAELTRAGAPAARAPRAVAPIASGEDLAVLLYTSGSMGAPKGAMLSHRALIANHRQVARVDPPIVRAGDVVLLALPFFHAFGLNSSLGAVAWHGACGVLVEQFDPAESLDLIARYRVSVVPAVPQMFHAWSGLPDLRERMATVRVNVSGAAPLDLAVADRFQAATGHPIFQGYGLTETAPVVATALASPVAKSGSIGRPIPGVEIKLVGADGAEIARIGPSGITQGADVVGGDAVGHVVGGGVGAGDFDDDAGGAPGTDPGEIVVRGPNLFGGYWPDGAGGPDAEGWWPTGDVAYVDADGDLFLVDRLGELIMVSGFNVYPTEVEQVLTSHPGVAEAAVVGVDDPQTGQVVRAYVVLDSGAEVAAADLSEHCRRNLARFKCPATIEFVPGLPHSATGKVRKPLLGRDELEGGPWPYG